ETRWDVPRNQRFRGLVQAANLNSNQDRLVYSYRNVATGFAAKLTAAEAKAMQNKEGFISARPQKVLRIHTTHTPNFLGLQQNTGFWNHSNYGKGMIIALLDTGITPSHPSFTDLGMPPPPAKWKGTCEFNSTICNNKVIGARSFVYPGNPPVDGHGHGTHTASTAAGSAVPGVEYNGQLNGTAIGMAPLAHLAMYQVCNAGGSCTESDVLAGMDAAVEDGVDVISVSLGYGPQQYFYENPIAVGAFGATQKGVFVSCSAGNFGPGGRSLNNDAPWILTVGASTREIRATVVLGNNAEFDGQSFYQPQNFTSALLPLVYPGASGNDSAAFCEPGSLSGFDVAGKVVVCDRSPGVNILAGWPYSSLTKSYFTLLSGTSMACPHLAGTAALIKSSHPDWSPAAIKSAIITTANITNLGGNPITDVYYTPVDMFATGAVHVYPPRADDPGFVYDIQPDDYIRLGYNDTVVEIIVGHKVECSNSSSIPEAQLNYPSFSLQLGSTPQTYTRTVTNVGPVQSSYDVRIVEPEGVDVKVPPATIMFSGANQTTTYSVTFTKVAGTTGSLVQGYLFWVSNNLYGENPNATIFNSQATAARIVSSPEGDKLETYIVFIRKPEGMSQETKDLEDLYRYYLPAATLSSNQDRLVYSYRNVAAAFAAKLTAAEAEAMKNKEGFISAHPQKVLHTYTTHTPNFLGLQQNTGFWNRSNYGKGMVIALLDTGITPSHPSFTDSGMPPPPAKWKGTCEFNSTICNNKVIGARSFVSPGNPPVDGHGHGTHTASTAAGSAVPGVNYGGQLNGTAIGMAPLAHLAIYQVCDAGGSCTESDVLAGMDAAVEDGADVLSLSLGYGPLKYFYDNPIAVGAFGAIQKGAFVSCAAGNSGPESRTLSNDAPWILTVGASTVDREIRATLVLQNNAEFDGQSFYQPQNFSSALLPLVYPGASGNFSMAFCLPGSLRDVDVAGKIVVCDNGDYGFPDGQEVKDAGGAAMILANDMEYGNVTSAYQYVLPTSNVNYGDGLRIKSYINYTSSPMATIVFKGTVYGVPYAPQVADFSSRGPSLASPGILKPDILGPGVNILAGWPYDSFTKSYFTILSGTSMACPHLAGTAALIKSSHPDWSPAAIKSAIITTANITNLGGNPITDEFFAPVNIFATGGGHVFPPGADDPGFVYDTQPDDYIPYLCGLGYNDTAIEIIMGHKVECSNSSTIPEAQLNYPSFSLQLGSTPQTYRRTVTNVGPVESSYDVQIVKPEGVDIQVTPTTIMFSGANQTATYSVTFTKVAGTRGSLVQGYLYWVSSDLHVVRSPLAVLFHNRQATAERIVSSPEETRGHVPRNRRLRGLVQAATLSSSQDRLVYSYRNVATGFAAKLTAAEAKAMQNKEGFISAQPQKVLRIHTTHTPNFLGLQQNTGFWNHSNYGKGMVIALMDTGITPNHPSFTDSEMPPPPAKWKGTCKFNSTICNNKVIGARSYVSPGKPPVDGHGHGTHTASTAAGSAVPGVNYGGQLNGTAIGMAPLAHLAIYQVCDAGGFCTESDVLAGMDAAVEDGADVLSLSLGYGPQKYFYENPIAVGAFGAIQKGAFVSCAAGNSGPEGKSLSNDAPWILTVGASTVDREIRATVVLGNNAEFDGQSFYQPQNFSSALLPLVYPGASGNSSAAFCQQGSLRDFDVAGKIVVCDGFTDGQEVKDAGGAAMILANDKDYGNVTSAYEYVLPASNVNYGDGLSIKSYLNYTSSPMATIIFKGTVYGVPYAPQVADFSSRGPSLASPGILKPDILGPGVDILAGWPYSSLTKSYFTLLSGTSMACPHLAGTAALLKSSHPDWSPAAIKSAIITTANITNLGGNPISDQFFAPADIFATGAGHVYPPRADDPGFVYDIQPADYIRYLCGLGYNDTAIEIIVGNKVECSNASSIPEAQLNYPSFSLRLGSTPQTYTRTVTNVGPVESSYDVRIVAPEGVDVTVTPSTIKFSSAIKYATYSVTFTKVSGTTGSLVQGYLYWVSTDLH
ncbi:hypothetical protein Tsubulata_017965, partial [Turnera subulata]